LAEVVSRGNSNERGAAPNDRLGSGLSEGIAIELWPIQTASFRCPTGANVVVSILLSRPVRRAGRRLAEDRLTEHRADEVQRVLERLEVMDFRFVTDMQDHPDVTVKRRVDQVRECAIPVRRDGDPAVNCRLIGPSVTDVGR
jgi:hypothetical protein